MSFALGFRALRLGQVCRPQLRNLQRSPPGRTAASAALVMPKRKRAALKADIVEETTTIAATVVVEEEHPRRRSSRKPKVVKFVAIESSVTAELQKEGSPLTELSEEEEQKPAPKKRRRRKKDDEPVVYDIPPVERKYTNFKGTYFDISSDSVLMQTYREARIRLSEYGVASAEAGSYLLLQDVSPRNNPQKRA